MKIALPAVIAQIRTLADNTDRITIDLQETSPEAISELYRIKKEGGFGHFLFKEKVITEEDVKDLPDIKLERFEKHPSQRMRAILFRMWEQSKTDQEFEVWYRAKMDSLCEMLKEKLN